MLIKTMNLQFTVHPRPLQVTTHKWRRPANMDGDVEMVEFEDQEIYGRRYMSQTAISAVTAYICLIKKTEGIKF